MSKRDEIRALETIDDAICNIYSGQDADYIHRMDADDRERLREDLDDIIDSLREWAARNDFEY